MRALRAASSGEAGAFTGRPPAGMAFCCAAVWDAPSVDANEGAMLTVVFTSASEPCG
ncbi:hypothetical protein [Cohnella sp. GCM10012308]|uniref:hypothetical protein n=1 Tax=Cohnella sp. GCM10012308 TaxID=3317329 RepID=UPI0036105378